MDGRGPVLSFLSLVVLVSAPARPCCSDEDPDALFWRQDWPAAERAYALRVRSHPDDAQAHFRLGLALLRLGKAKDALPSLEHAETLGWPAAQVAFRLACARTRLGQNEEAWRQLELAGRDGFSQVSLLESEPDLIPLHGQARFAAMLETADRNAHPCLYHPGYSQFDFWLGEWDVRPEGASVSSPAASNVVRKVLEGCVVLEDWSGQYRGQSFNIFDASDTKWHQTWVDATGQLHEYVGQIDKDGNMVFLGSAPKSVGQPKLPTRLTFFRLGPDRVRQFSESSSDAGKTWTTNYDLVYTRRGPRAAPPSAR
ncbi:MAG TPA: hypothetical protein VN461_04775 [Vicinamibacteria bacterium]|jgi:hypothetical protein|nr:hypothetical protein [Vicinamibacteria bacterium]